MLSENVSQCLDVGKRNKCHKKKKKKKTLNIHFAPNRLSFKHSGQTQALSPIRLQGLSISPICVGRCT